MGSDLILIMTSCEKKEDAMNIAKACVDSKSAACVQIHGPVDSVYSWNDVLEQTQEWVCSIKTRDTHFESVQKLIQSIHPYELPEIIAVPISNVSDDYLNWVHDNVSH